MPCQYDPSPLSTPPTCAFKGAPALNANSNFKCFQLQVLFGELSDIHQCPDRRAGALSGPALIVTCDNSFDLCWATCNSVMCGIVCILVLPSASSLKSANSSSNAAVADAWGA